jgi:hypothetical protein
MHKSQLQPQPLCRQQQGSTPYTITTAVDNHRLLSHRSLKRAQHLCKALHSSGSCQHANFPPAWPTTQHADTTCLLLGPTGAASRSCLQSFKNIVTAAAAAADAAVSSRWPKGEAPASPAAADGSAGSTAGIRAAAQQQSLGVLEWRDVCRQVGTPVPILC